jgi:hypothetical protein
MAMPADAPSALGLSTSDFILHSCAMTDCPPDLLPLISEARRLVPDDRHIWCSAADTFDSRLIQRRGLLLGSALSPHFLRDSTATNWDTPWTVRLRHCRVVVCDKAAHEPVAAWLPLMESVVAASESLLVVTETIDSELLATFTVNAFKGTLRRCVVHPVRGNSGNVAAGAHSPLRRQASTSCCASTMSGSVARPQSAFPRRVTLCRPPLLSRISSSSKPTVKITNTNTTGFAF